MGKLSIDDLKNFQKDLDSLIGRHDGVINAHPKEIGEPIRGITRATTKIYNDATEKDRPMPGKISA